MAAENMPAAMTPSGPASTKMTEARTPEARIKHDELKITPAQETQWNNVAHVMLVSVRSDAPCAE
jgi:hypothetical protein